MANKQPYPPIEEAPLAARPPPPSAAYQAPPAGQALGFQTPKIGHALPTLPSNQPQQGIPVLQMPTSAVAGNWTTGLWDCFDDIGLCCITCWLPCITVGQIAEIVDGGTTTCVASGAVYGLICSMFPGLQFLYSCWYRSKLRAQYNLPEEPCIDCFAHYCCEGLALCQEYRELRNRGYDLSIGWEGNVQKMRDVNTTVGVPPPVQGGMSR